MRSTAGFIAALVAAALAFVLIHSFVLGLDLSSEYFLFAVVVSTVVGLPAVLLGGFPIWVALRRRGIYSAKAFALAGAILAVITLLLLLGTGPMRSYDPPETFLQALSDPGRLAQFAATAFSGGTGGLVFWRIAVKPVHGGGAIVSSG
jgi:hypothetical protein